MNVMKSVTFAAVATFAAAACAVQVDYAGKDPAAKFAAGELGRFLKGSAGRIALREDPAMAAQAWRIKSAADGTLVISGRDGMGIAYGAFTFLERHVGVRWFAPDTEFVPDLGKWTMPVLDESGAPSYAYREMYVGDDYVDGFWRFRNKETMQHPVFGAGVHYGSSGDCHTFDRFANALRKVHPELFGKKRNARGGTCRGLCMSDETTRRFVAEELCRYIEKDRKPILEGGKPRYLIPTFYDLSQPDGPSGDECMCEGCRALSDAAGSYSGANIAFVNAVAGAVAERYPDVSIQTFAYAYTATPPTNDLVAAANVNMRYCSGQVFDPLLKGTPQGDTFESWSKHAKQFGIWSYWRTYRGLLFPFVKKRAEIAAEIRFCRENGATRYFAENEEPISRSFAMMQHWLFLKLTDDPSQDVFALSREFIRGYYRAAAKPVEDYLDYLESRQKSGAGCQNDPQKQHLDREFFEKVNAWLDEAEALVKDDPIALRHVRWERVIVDRTMYDLFTDLRKAGYTFDRTAVADRFLANARAQIENWREFVDHPKLKARRLQEVEEEARLYAYYPIATPPEFDGLDVVPIEWNKLIGEGAATASDPDAAAGTAFYNPKFDYALPFNMGVYNCILKTGGSVRFQNRRDVPQDEKFHVYRIGRQLIMSPMAFFFDGSWGCMRYMQTLGIVPEYREVWISMKFQGPAFVTGSTKPNRVLFDRAFYVKNDDPMRRYRKVGENLVPAAQRSFVVTSPDGRPAAKRVTLGDPAKMDCDLLIRGTCSWKGVLSPDAGQGREYPFVGLWAFTQKGARNAFTRSCREIFFGDYEKQEFELVVEAGQLKGYVRDAGESLMLTFRIAMEKQPATVRVDDLEIIPVRKKRK